MDNPATFGKASRDRIARSVRATEAMRPRPAGDGGPLIVPQRGYWLMQNSAAQLGGTTANTWTIFSGTKGSEASSGQTGFDVYLRNGFTYANVTYRVGEIDGVLEVLNAGPAPGIQFYNSDASNTVPAYGVVLVNQNHAVGGAICPAVIRPNVYGCQNNFLINQGTAVPPLSFGLAQFINGPMIAAYDSSTGTPSSGGALWGPGSGSYLLKNSYGGFYVIGIWDSTNHYALVMSQPMLTFRGQPTTDVAPGATGTVNVYTGSGAGTILTGVSVSGVRNDSSCSVRANKLATCQIIPDADVTNPLVPIWQFIVGATS